MSWRAGRTPALLDTPWGPPQTVAQLGDGVWEVTTASHGGIHLAPHRQAIIPAPWRDPECWYEEDDEWAYVAMTFPGLFQPEVRDYAHLLGATYHADVYQQVFGQKALDQVLSREQKIRQALKNRPADCQQVDDLLRSS